MISIIVAVSNNWVIGSDGRLPWHLPEDLKYFRKITKGNTVIMGHNTFKSINGPLKGRRNIILSRDKDLKIEECEIKNSVDDVLSSTQNDNLFVIGGSQVYNLFLPMTNMLYVTKIDTEINGDVKFPEISENEWELVSEDKRTKDEKNHFNYSFMVYRRKEERN